MSVTEQHIHSIGTNIHNKELCLLLRSPLHGQQDLRESGMCLLPQWASISKTGIACEQEKQGTHAEFPGKQEHYHSKLDQKRRKMLDMLDCETKEHKTLLWGLLGLLERNLPWALGASLWTTRLWKCTVFKLLSWLPGCWSRKCGIYKQYWQEGWPGIWSLCDSDISKSPKRDLPICCSWHQIAHRDSQPKESKNKSCCQTVRGIQTFSLRQVTGYSITKYSCLNKAILISKSLLAEFYHANQSS